MATAAPTTHTAHRPSPLPTAGSRPAMLSKDAKTTQMATALSTHASQLPGLESYDRETATHALNIKPTGTFIIRPGSRDPHKFVVSVAVPGKVVHIESTCSLEEFKTNKEEQTRIAKNIQGYFTVHTPKLTPLNPTK